MKSKVLVHSLLIAALAVPAVSVFAQDSATATPDQQTQTQGEQAKGHRGMRGEGKGRRMEWMAKQLNLTDDQKQQLKQHHEQERQQWQALRQDTSLTKDQKREKMKAMRQQDQQYLDSILTADQKTKLEQLKQERKARHQNDGGQNQNNSSPQG
jgi:periplasmic protein CpxP/Spy